MLKTSKYIYAKMDVNDELHLINILRLCILENDLNKLL